MKNLIAFCFIAFFSFKATAQDAEAYQKYMQESIALYDSVKTLADYQEIRIRHFENTIDKYMAMEPKRPNMKALQRT